MVASEVKNPQRNLPLALIGGTLRGDRRLYAGQLGLFPGPYHRPWWAWHKLVAAEMMRRVLKP